MSFQTLIEWAETTWNPVRGCTKVSPGCARCYAETFAERFRGVAGHPYERGFDLRLVPDPYIEAVARVMTWADWHTYQVLTKRADRMRELLCTSLLPAAELPHVWWGVSVENRKHGLPRLEELRAAPAAVRFLSVEPLLEDLGPLNLDGIHWVIVGGESGPGARPMEEAWVRSIRDQCRERGVPFFFKQWGGVRKGKSGRTLDGRTHDEFPPRVERPVAGATARAAWIAATEHAAKQFTEGGVR
jgi:protein gp37